VALPLGEQPLDVFVGRRPRRRLRLCRELRCDEQSESAGGDGSEHARLSSTSRTTLTCPQA